MLQITAIRPIFASIGLCLATCVACGGSDSGSASPGGAGSNSAAGQSSGGGAPGGSGAGGSGAGGRPSSASGDYSSGVPGDKQLGSLSEQEFQGLCKKLDDYFSTGPVAAGIEEFNCRMSGLFGAALSGAQTDAALQTACKPVYDACIAAPTMATSTCTKPDATCTATVAEYDACLNDSLDALSTLQNALPSCDKLTVASLGSLGSLGGATSAQESASCQTVKAKCPSAPPAPGLGESSDATD